MNGQLTQRRGESSVFFPFVMFGSRTAMIGRRVEKFLSPDPRSAGASPSEPGCREDEETRNPRRHRPPRRARAFAKNKASLCRHDDIVKLSAALAVALRDTHVALPTNASNRHVVAVDRLRSSPSRISSPLWITHRPTFGVVRAKKGICTMHDLSFRYTQ